MTITGNFECSQYFIFETKFLKNKNLFFKKLGNSYVVNSTMIESVTYPYKTVLSGANVKINRVGSTKMDRSQRTQFFQYPFYFFWAFCFSIRTFYKELIWSTNYPNVHIHTSQKCWSFIWGCFFPVSILKTYSAATIRNDFNVSYFMRAVLLFLHVH